MALRFLDDGGYAGGMNRDKPSWMLDRGEVYDALNILFDKPGIARQRMGTTAIFSGAQAAFADVLGFIRQDDNAARLELFGFDSPSGELYRINRTTGATTDIGGYANSGNPGRAAQHFGFLVFPQAQDASFLNNCTLITAGPVAVASSFSSTVGVNTTAGSPTITLTAPDATTNIQVGYTVRLATTPVVAGQFQYYGRVTSIVSATQFTVWPTPTHTVAYAGAGALTCRFAETLPNAACAASFQNRLLLGNVAVGTSTYDRRFIYSLLPGEEYTGSTGAVSGGATWIENSTAIGYPPNNFIEVPIADPFVGMEAVNDNELLILTARRPVVFRGNLVTQLATTSQQVTFDVTEIDRLAGCLSDHSICRTSRGVMWAGGDGIFLYTGSDAINVLDGKMATYWRGLARSSTFDIYAAAYMRGHYLVCGTSGGSDFQLLVNLQSREYVFSRVSGISFTSAVVNPATPQQVFASRWWVYPTRTSFTNGATIRLESILDAYVTGATTRDSDTSVVPFSITSRVLAGDPETQKIQQRMTVRYQAAMPAASVTLTAQSKIDAADISANSVRALGSLSNTETRTISAATNATPIVCTTSVVHGLQTDDFVDINGGLVNTHVNGRWRVVVSSTTQFSLLGSSGNGAYTASSATMKKVTEDDFQTNTLDQGQGISFVIASSSTVNNFELHGLRIAYFENAPVMSA